MAFCTYCGTEVAEGLAACPKCGHPQAVVAAPAPGQAVAQAVPGRRVEGLAIASLILGIAGLVVCPIVPSILAIIFGNQARNKIEIDPTLEGDGMAKTGVILGWVGIGLTVLVAVGAIIILVLVADGSPDVRFGAPAMLR
jgi:hypothetical protein